MVRKVMRPSGRSGAMIRYRQVAEPPEAAASLAGRDSPAISSWHGLRIKLEDLADFKAKRGLVTVYAEWPEGDPCPILYLVEVELWNPIDRAPGSA
jgi:hypothetical protein